MKSIKRLFYDLEVSPGVYWAWRPGYNINLSYKNQLKEAAIICVSYKWEHKRKVHHLVWDKNQSDKELVRKFIDVLNEADEICGHNSDSFDLKWIRTRAIKHGIPMSPDFVAYDTWKEAKKLFRFDSSSLDYISKYLGVKEKKETGGSGLWTEVVFDKCKKALTEMVAYCDNDVLSQSEVFEKMKPYIKNKSHIGGSTRSCPECGSAHVHIDGYRVTAAGHKRVTFQCQDCGKFHSMARARFEKDKAI